MSVATAQLSESMVAQLRSLLQHEGWPSDAENIRKRLIGILLEKDCPVPEHSCILSPGLRAAVAEMGWPQALEQLLSLGATADDRNCRGDTVLHLAFAVDEGSSGLQFLMDRILPAATENSTNCHGLSFLHIASAKSTSAAVQKLLDVFLIEIDYQISTGLGSPYAGYTPLHFAVHHGQLEVAALLLRHDADICAQDRNGSSPLHLAFERGDTNMIDLILMNDHRHENCVNNSGITHFMAACAGSSSIAVYEFLQVAETLRHVPARSLTNERIKDSRHPFAGCTSLHLAARCGNLQTVQILLENGASCFAINSNNSTPLDVARALGFEEICQLLHRFCDVRKEELLISWMEGMTCA